MGEKLHHDVAQSQSRVLHQRSEWANIEMQCKAMQCGAKKSPASPVMGNAVHKSEDDRNFLGGKTYRLLLLRGISTLAFNRHHLLGWGLDVIYQN